LSADQLRNHVASLQKIIAKLQGDKSKKVEDAAKAGKRSSDALAAAARTSSISTATSKHRDAVRYAGDQAKAQVEIGKIEKKIAAENKKLIAVQRRLDDEISRYMHQIECPPQYHTESPDCRNMGISFESFPAPILPPTKSPYRPLLGLPFKPELAAPWNIETNLYTFTFNLLDDTGYGYVAQAEFEAVHLQAAALRHYFQLLAMHAAPAHDSRTRTPIISRF
jgi:hypothetical protein